jgi:hypothetical protein
MEVTPNGEVIWEFYLRWGAYEAERMQLGDEPGGPTMRDQNLTGDYGVRGSVGLAPRTGEEQTVSQWLASLGTAIPSKRNYRLRLSAGRTPRRGSVRSGWIFGRSRARDSRDSSSLDGDSRRSSIAARASMQPE